MLLFLILLFFGSRLTPYLCLLKWCFCFNLFFTLLFLRLLYAESVFVNALHVLLIHGFQYLAAHRHSALGSEPLSGQAGCRVGKPERFLHGAAPRNLYGKCTV